MQHPVPTLSLFVVDPLRRWLTLALMAGLLALGLSADLAAQRSRGEVKAAAKAVESAFRTPWDRPGAGDARNDALAAMQGLDGKVAAEGLVEAYQALETELAALEVLRQEQRAELAEIMAGVERTPTGIRAPQGVLNRINEIKKDSIQLREGVDQLRAWQRTLGERIGDLSDEEAQGYLADKVLTGKKNSLPLRLAVGRALGGAAGSLLEDLAKDLSRAKDVDTKVAILEVARQIGPDAGPMAGPALELLGDKDPIVQESAALACAYMRVGAAIEPMINLMADMEGQAKLRVAGALELLTGQQHGVSVGAWRAWFKAEGQGLAADQERLGGGMFRLPRRKGAGDYYFGLPMDGRSIVYIIDASGSMQEEIEWPKESGKMITRLQACQSELVKALALLNPKQKFNVVWYNDQVFTFADRMEAANPRTIAKAKKWVEELTPSSTTNIHDAVQEAFQFAGRGVKDRYYGLDVDLMFLLTDGAPTRPDNQPDSTDRILEAVRTWNPLKKVTLHTIGIGRGVNAGFMRQLALENHGEFRHY